MSETGTVATALKSKTKNSSNWLAAASSVLIFFLAVGLVITQMTPSAVKPASTPVTSFSAERALVSLGEIAKAPHPTGSPDNLRVSQYLFDQLTSLGLKPEFQSSTSVYIDRGKWGVAGPRGLEINQETWSLAGANIRNVVARIPGTNSTGAVVLMAHFDSVPYGPGASDDGAGTAAILETARALLVSPPLRNDIILLLTDGEEIGLMGSQAFAKNHPWMQDVTVVFNLEARGSSGTPIMYETSTDNAWLIREYARAAQSPVTGSVATDVYRLLPNSSDLTVFLEDGRQGLNFAYTDNWTDYHTSHDSLQDLDPRSLQHHGDNALALARHFGSIDLADQTPGDAVFFSIPRLGIIHYPKQWALPLSLVASAAFVMAIFFGIRRRTISLRGMGRGLAAFLLSAIAAALIAFLVVQGLIAIKGGELQIGMGGTYNSHYYELGLLVINLAVGAVIFEKFRRSTSAEDLVTGALVLWLILAVGSAIFLPGGSYLFVWPLLAGLAILFITILAPRSQSILFLRVIPAAIAVLLFGTAIFLVTIMFGVIAYPATGALAILILALFYPYLDFRSLPRRPAWLAGSILIGVLVILAGAVKGYSTEQPRQNILYYHMNADTGTAAWVARTTLPDASLEPWLSGTAEEGTWQDYFPAAWDDPVWTSPAPVVNQPFPVMTVLEDSTNGEWRTLRLHLQSMRSAWAVMANVAAEDAILEAELAGESDTQQTPRDHVFIKWIAVPDDGIDFTIKLLAGVPVTVKIADVVPSLPQIDGYPAQEISAIRTGYGGGHGIDSMSLIQREYMIK